MQLDPEIKEAAVNCANCYIVEGSLNQALALCDELLEKMPDYPLAVLLAGVIFCIQGNSQKARELFKRLFLQKFNTTNAMNRMARQLFSRKKTVEASALLNAVIQNGVGDQKTTELLQLVEETMQSNAPS